MGEYPTRTTPESTYREDAHKHSEGKVARALEDQTAQIPSDVWLWAALGAMGAAATCQAFGKRQTSLFLGQWVAPLLLVGVYNKIVKTQGSDRLHAGRP